MTDTASPVLSVPDTTAPVAAPTDPAQPIAQPRALSLVALILSASAILIGQGPLAIGGIVAGFVARRDEPAHRTLSTWGIVLGFVALFGWLVLALVGVSVFVPLWLSGAFGS